MLKELARERPGVERVAYLDGVRLGTADSASEDGLELVHETPAVVTTVTIPDAVLHPGWFRVPAESMRAAGKHLRDLRLMRLAQVHTHGGSWVGHSGTDDDDSYSQRVGAVSIVLPQHANDQQQLDGAGIHVRDRDAWRQLAQAEVARAIQFIPELIDLREDTCLDWATGTPVTPAALFDQQLRRWPARWWSKFIRR